jgi:3-hydroxyacyl-CoA dehydrogenase
LLEGAVGFARKIAGKRAPKTREHDNRLGTSEGNAAIFAAARKAIKKQQPGLEAPLVAVDSIETGTLVGFDEGCKKEREFFKRCLFSDQSKALVHLFLAEREASKIPDVPKDTPTIPVKLIAVIGAGTRGIGIAMAFADAGFQVLIKEADQPALDRGMASIQKSYGGAVNRGRLLPKDAQERLGRIQPTLDYAPLAESDLVIEAVFESMDLKQQVFGELDRICKPGAILATSTSTLDIDKIAASISRPQSVIGLHFFNPVNMRRPLEVVRGDKTAKEVLATCMQLGKKISGVAVLAGNCRGFVGNRMFIPYAQEAQFMVEEGASPEAVDTALRDFGMAMGPFEACDAQRTASSDPLVAEWLPKLRGEFSLPQRSISADEIIERCVYILVNVGAKILVEGCALRSGDIDTIFVNGYGFPAFRGGPMWYADTVGLGKVYERLREFQKQHGDRHEPASLLKRLAKTNGKFPGYQREAGRK